MKGYIPPDCTPPDRHREERESEDQRRQLEREPSRRLHEVLLDAAESFTARATALMLLLQCQDPEVFRRLPDLFDDPQLGRMAVRYSRPSDPATAERLHGLLGPARGRHWPEAALALARAKDPSVRPFLLGWLGSGDTGEINVAVEGLVLLNTAGALELFQQAWDASGGGEERRLILAAALLRLRDTRGAGLLEEVARRADGPWAVFAAFGLAGYDAPRAYRLMLGILDDGGLDAKRSLVMQVWNICEAPHAFTADGLHEARVWVERQIQRHEMMDSGPTSRATQTPYAAGCTDNR